MQSVVIRGSLLSLPIRGHFRHGTNPSQGGRGYGRNGTKGLTYTLVYGEKYLTLPAKTAITGHLGVPSEQTPNQNQNNKPQNKIL